MYMRFGAVWFQSYIRGLEMFPPQINTTQEIQNEFFSVSVVLEMELRVVHKLGKCSIIELHPQPEIQVFLSINKVLIGRLPCSFIYTASIPAFVL